MDYTKLAQQFGGSTTTVPKTGGVDYSALASKFGATPIAPIQEGGMNKYNVAPVSAPQESSADKIARLNKEQIGYDQAAKKAGSFFGILGNTLKGSGEIIASSEIGLGNTIGKIAGSKNLDVYSKAIESANQSNITLTRLIKEKEARGEDASNLKRAYNANLDSIEANKKEIGDYGASLPTQNEVLGQLGGTALDVLTAGTYGKATSTMTKGKLAKETVPFLKSATKAAIPEVSKVAEIASKPTGIGTLRGVTNIAKGAAVGYGSDVTEGLQGHRGEDRKDGNALIPGLGTVIGASIPAATETAQSFKNKRTPDPTTGLTPKQTKNIKKYASEIDNIENNYQKLKKVSDNPKRIKAKENLAKSGLLENSIDHEGTINVRQKGGALEKFNEFISPYEDNVTKIVKNEGVEITREQALKKLTANIEASDISGADRINALNKVRKEVAGLRVNKNGKIDLSEVQKAKIYKGMHIDYMNPSAKKYDKTVVRSLKELVEDFSENPEIKRINSDLSELYDMKNLIVSLDGRKVKGGKLGKYFAKVVGAVAGGQIGGIGGGLLGAEITGRIYGRNLSSKFKGKTGMILQPSETMKLAERSANSLKLKVKNLPSDYTNELPTIPFGEKGVSKLEASSKNLPIAEGSPKVFGPEVKSVSVPKKKASMYEAYTPNEKLPIIPAGPSAPKKKLDLPVVEKSPDVYVQSKRSSSQSKKLGTLDKSVSLKKAQTNAKTITPKIPKPNMSSSIPQSKRKVNMSKPTDDFLSNWIRNEIKTTPKDYQTIEKELSQYKPTKPVKLYRGTNPDGKETGPLSWTYNKEAARDHADEAGGKVISKMVHPDEILVDLTDLPGELAQKYGIIDEEEEVILKALKTNSIVKSNGLKNVAKGAYVMKELSKHISAKENMQLMSNIADKFPDGNYTTNDVLNEAKNLGFGKKSNGLGNLLDKK